MKAINVIIIILLVLAIGQCETDPFWGLFHGLIGFVLYIQTHVGWAEFKKFINEM